MIGSTPNSVQMQSTRRIGVESVFAWGVVAFAHLFFVWVATRTSLPHPLISQPMELVLIQLPKLLPAPAEASRLPKTVSSSQIAARLALRATIEMTRHPSRASSPEHPLQVTTDDDQWSSSSEPAGKYDGIQFNRNKLTTSFNPIRAGAPPRLRLRREYTARDVLRAVSSELFWPPGYTDDPCPGMAKAVEILSAGSTAREHMLLEDAVLQQSRYCN